MDEILTELKEILQIMVEEDSTVVADKSPHKIQTIERAMTVLRKLGWYGPTYGEKFKKEK